MWNASEERIKSLQEKNYILDRLMKEVHQKGYYIKRMDYPLNPESFLENLEKYEREEKEEVIKTNLLDFSVLSLGEYVGNGSYLINKNNAARKMLKEMFSEYVPYLPQEDVAFYKKMIEENPIMYYSEFVDYRNKVQSDNGSNLSTTGKSYTKKTQAGSFYKENEPSSLNSNAYVRILLMPAYMIASILFFALAYFVLLMA